jgi:PleD family two-component response regulator
MSIAWRSRLSAPLCSSSSTTGCSAALTFSASISASKCAREASHHVAHVTHVVQQRPARAGASPARARTSRRRLFPRPTLTHEAAQTQPKTPHLETSATPIARRVLVVDDNRDAAQSLAMVLKLSGPDTYIAHDGLEAVEKAAQRSPDLVLLDIGLPKINGF